MIHTGLGVLFRDSVASVNLASVKRREEKKFKDPRRVNIANQYPLTQQQKQEIDEFFISNYGEKVDYVWHQNYAAHAGRFDYRFFPEHLYIPEFEAFQNQNKATVKMMGDKNFLPIVSKYAGVEMPRTIVSCTNGVLRDGENHIITEVIAKELLKEKEVFFVKPSVDSCSGRGCKRVSDKDEWSITSNSRIINGGGYKQNYVVQELITCHESIRKLYPDSVNTFRVISYLWKGNIEMMPIIIRIGQGGNYIDNAHAGGMFCAVNDDGSMGDHAVTEFNDQYKEHPDTHTVFANHVINHIDKIIDAAKKMHSVIPQIGVVNWDFTVNEEGNPILIEANVEGGSIWLPQMAHGKGGFGEKTAEVLQWLRFMKKLKPHERVQFAYGRLE